MLNKDDIEKLIEWLSLKDDKIRYQSLLLLQNRSAFFDDVYPFWDIFKNKLNSDNSYQRNIGVTLIADNIKWDKNNKINDTVDECLEILHDEKPITVRLCIQSLGKIASCKPELNDKIISKLISFDILSVKETMRKSIILDILNVLLTVKKVYSTYEMENYIRNTLSGDILDKKTKKEFETLFDLKS
jgi:hypothetical protein